MEFLQLEEIRQKAEKIRATLDSLLTSKALAAKPEARQWRFMRSSLERLLSPEQPSEFDSMTKVRAAQYKFEIEQKLNRFYNSRGRALDYAFVFVHEAKLATYFDDWQKYPVIAEYALLVRDLSSDRKDTAEGQIEDLKQYFERVVDEANDAEFRAYAALPEIRTEEIYRWFCADSPAFNEVMGVIHHQKERRWNLSNLYNPSTKRLLDVKVKKVGQNEAIVDTLEYWYLRWWDEVERSYAYAYRETTRQTYVLKREGEKWKVFQEIRPLPRTSAPNRWNRRQKL